MFSAWGGLTTVARQPVAEMLRPENLPYTANATRKIMLEYVKGSKLVRNS